MGACGGLAADAGHVRARHVVAQGPPPTPTPPEGRRLCASRRSRRRAAAVNGGHGGRESRRRNFAHTAPSAWSRDGADTPRHGLRACQPHVAPAAAAKSRVQLPPDGVRGGGLRRGGQPRQLLMYGPKKLYKCTRVCAAEGSREAHLAGERRPGAATSAAVEARRASLGTGPALGHGSARRCRGARRGGE